VQWLDETVLNTTRNESLAPVRDTSRHIIRLFAILQLSLRLIFIGMFLLCLSSCIWTAKRTLCSGQQWLCGTLPTAHSGRPWRHGHCPRQ
jgi:hypothetical protein